MTPKLISFVALVPKIGKINQNRIKYKVLKI
jgi:hypothetical protein